VKVGVGFDTIFTEEIQTDSQRVLNVLTEKDFEEHSKNGEDGETSVYMQ
jgi:hypothetical protein